MNDHIIEIYSENSFAESLKASIYKTLNIKDHWTFFCVIINALLFISANITGISVALNNNNTHCYNKLIMNLDLWLLVFCTVCLTFCFVNYCIAGIICGYFLHNISKIESLHYIFERMSICADISVFVMLFVGVTELIYRHYNFCIEEQPLIYCTILVPIINLYNMI